MSTPVIIKWGLLPSNWCPSTPQDLVNELNFIVSGQDGTGAQVRIQFGVLPLGLCDPTSPQFVEALAGVSSGFVLNTGDTVRVTYAVPADRQFCWSDPQAIVDWLGANYTAYVEGT
jgi:hypothetical protein